LEEQIPSKQLIDSTKVDSLHPMYFQECMEYISINYLTIIPIILSSFACFFALIAYLNRRKQSNINSEIILAAKESLESKKNKQDLLNTKEELELKKEESKLLSKKLSQLNEEVERDIPRAARQIFLENKLFELENDLSNKYSEFKNLESQLAKLRTSSQPSPEIIAKIKSDINIKASIRIDIQRVQGLLIILIFGFALLYLFNNSIIILYLASIILPFFFYYIYLQILDTNRNLKKTRNIMIILMTLLLIIIFVFVYNKILL